MTLRHKCPICNDVIESQFPPWTNPHYLKYHRDYAIWLRNWVRILVVATLIDLVYEVLILRQLSSQGFWTLFSGVMVVVISGYALVFAHRWKLRVFRHEWGEQHHPER